MKQSVAQKITIILTIVNMILICAGCGSTGSSEAPATAVTHLTTNYAENPLCIEGTPYFSWQMESSKQGAAQSAYQLFVAESSDALAAGEYLWDSGKIASDISVSIPYEGAPLSSNTEYVWTVQVWDQDEKMLEKPAPVSFGTALEESDWQGAKWIYAGPLSISDTEPFQGIINYNTVCADSVSGFFFGATDSYYGDYYRVVLDTLEEQALLRISEMHYETVKAETVLPVKAKDYVYLKDQPHRVFISVCNGEIEVAVDHNPLGKHKIEGELLPLGSVGFWTTRGSYYGYYDDLEIYPGTQLEGDLSPIKTSSVPIVEEHFEDPNVTIFSPYRCPMKALGVGDGDWFVANSGFTITPGSMEPAPVFYKDFQVEGKVAKARLYASALGTFDLYINNTPVSDGYYAPGQSDYAKEVFYASYDVTDLLKENATNSLLSVLGHGRYDRAKSEWGEDLAWIGVLKIDYTDGSTSYVTTDDSFLCNTDGPVRNDDMYAGEVYDARKEIPGMPSAFRSGMNDPESIDLSTWTSSSVLPFSGKQKEPVKVPMISPFDVCIEQIAPVSVAEPVPGTYVCDFGVNLTGFCQLTGKGTAHEPVTLRYAEALNEENLSNADDVPGTIWTQGLFTARNTDYYIPANGDLFTYAPRFVYRGFRYVQITGLTEAPTVDSIRAMVISADCPQSGTFSCSDDKINRLFDAIYRTQQNNYVDIPTDCPQRDERFGWAGDAQVFAHTADYNANTHLFMKEYLRTLVSERNSQGAFPDMTGCYENGGSNGWADAGIILTYELYQQYGDISVILENVDAMCRYMDYLVETSDDYIRCMDSYSDHIAESMISDEMCNTVQCAYVADLLSRMCAVIGDTARSDKYASIYEAYKKAWQDTFMNEDGSVGNWMQSEYVLPLAFRLYPEEMEAAGAGFLNISVQSSDYHAQTGYVSTPWILPVLCEYGYTDSAYQMILQDTFPSWNYMLSHNSTTMTEAFHALSENEDGTYAILNSLNHYALGSVGQWLYSDVVGIKRDDASPGYKHFLLQPRIHNCLSFAEGSYDSIYGTIYSRWELTEEGKVTYTCTVPANTSATLLLPIEGFETQELEAGSYSFEGTLVSP